MSENAQSVPPQGGQPFLRFLGVRLTPGVLPANMAAFYFAALVSILIFSFMNQAQTLLLTTFHGVDPAREGKISGDIVFWGEVVVLLLVGLFGTLSDKVGRLPIFALGFLVLGFSCFLHPEAQVVAAQIDRLLPGALEFSGLNGLLLLRLLYALGVAAVIGMLPTVLADYAVDADRGRATGINGVMNGIGAMITVFALLGLPSLLMGLGFDSQSAVRRTYQSVGYLAFFAALCLCIFLQRRTSSQAQRRETLWEITREGLRAARDPGVALAYGAAFLSRGLLTVLGVFFTVWGKQFGVEVGMSPEEAVKRVGVVIGVAQTFALLGAPLFGILTDRINRVTALVVTSAVAMLGYGATWFIQDPLGLELASLIGVMAVAAVIGLGEVGCIITSGVLIAQQAPRRIRGAVIGFFNLCGAAGILVASALGGRLFDEWRPAAPFLLFGALSVIVALWGLLVRNRVVPLREPGEPVAG